MMCDSGRMQRFIEWSSLTFALAAFIGSACASKNEPSEGRSGSDNSRTGKLAVDCIAARGTAATTWATWATNIDTQKTDAADSRSNLRIKYEVAADRGNKINANDETKTEGLNATAALAALDAVEQAYAPAIAAAHEAALELRSPQGASKHTAALQQAKRLLDAGIVVDRQSMDSAAATVASIELLELPAAALEIPDVKAKVEAIKAKRNAAIARVEQMRAARLEQSAGERKIITDLEAAFAPCAK